MPFVAPLDKCLSALDIVTYEAILFASAITLDDDVVKDLSSDQYYMYVWWAIITGKCLEDPCTAGARTLMPLDG